MLKKPEYDSHDGARITLRVPARLKKRIELCAAKDGQSVNTWIMRALEKVMAYEKA